MGDIYEIMFMNKEWIIAQGYAVLSGGMEDGKYACYIEYDRDEALLGDDGYMAFYADTEFEAVDKATEFIRKVLNG